MTVNDLDVLECSVIHDNTGTGEQINRLQFQLGTPAPVSDADVLTDLRDIFEELYNLIKTIVSIRNVLREIKVSNVTQVRLMGSTDAGTYVGGSALDPAIPQGAAPYLHFVTSVPRVILSKYLPSTNELALDNDGDLKTAALNQVISYGAFLMDEQFFGTKGYAYGFFSPKVLAFVFPQVLIVREVLAYQRRRKKGVGS